MSKQKKSKNELNEKEKLFCQIYISEEFFCNWVKSYLQVYKCSYNTAKTEANKLLTKPYILEYIDSLLEDMALNDQRVDKELAKMIIQDKDYTAKINGIKEYNKLKWRITEKLEANFKFDKEIKVKLPAK